jgi:hypothetical protein
MQVPRLGSVHTKLEYTQLACLCVAVFMSCFQAWVEDVRELENKVLNYVGWWLFLPPQNCASSLVMVFHCESLKLNLPFTLLAIGYFI